MPSRFRTRAALAAVCAAAACSDSPLAPNQDLAVTTAGPVRLVAGQASTVTVTVTNNSKSRTYRITSSSACEDPFTVTTASGTTYPATFHPCALSAPTWPALPPGQSLTLSRSWLGDVCTAANGGVGTLLSPGTYVLRGFVRVANGSTEITVASSAPLTTEILAR